MRIVAGSAGGIPLEIPKTNMRPTMDRIRGAIFSSLVDLVPGSRVLDLFAGSGALGLEALSRGAASATFVESHPKCAQAIIANLQKTRLEGTVVRQDVYTFLERADRGGEFDLIFADPPYCKTSDDRDFTRELIASKTLPRLLALEGLLVLEQAPDPEFTPPPWWKCIRRRKYGSTETLFLRSNGDPANATA